MAKLFDKISKDVRDGMGKEKTKKSKDWFRKQVSKLSVKPSTLLRDKDRKANKILPGKLFFFSYDPKTKEKLPYYDTFPLVLPVELYGDGFLGLNFHYIRPKHRLILMDKLYETISDNKYDEKTKLQITYSVLSGASRYKEFAPCLKRYLFNHIRSSFIEIHSVEWEIALMLPVESFVGAGKEKIYRDSQGMY